MRHSLLPRGALWGFLLATVSACAWPELHVQNVQSENGGTLIISGTGFTPNTAVRLSSRPPGGARRWLGSVFAEGPQGSFHDYRYTYLFSLPFEGDGCPPSLGGQPLLGLFVSVGAIDKPNRRETTDAVLVPDCKWAASSARSPIAAKN